MSTVESKKTQKQKILFLAQFSMLLAIEAIVSFTPLGSLPAIGPVVATLSHIPVIITALMLGTAAGMAMGFFFGLFSFLVMTFTPPGPTAFIFTPFYSFGEFKGNAWSLVICFAPRILIGLVAGLSYIVLKKALAESKAKNALAYGISGFLGSMTNTLLVLGGVYLFFGRSFASAIGAEYEVLLGIIGAMVLTSGLPEAVLAAFLAYAVCTPLKKALQKI
ncbi:MAG: ECF transporter S component [Clostridiales bacterium]|nr:ECF transporter S component [Clostridiales bacterium]